MKHQVKDAELLIELEADLLSTTVKQCLSEAQGIIDEAQGVRGVSIDMKAVNTVDSQGLNFLVGIYQECRSRDWSFKVVGASASLKRLFQFVKLTERFGIA